MCGFAGILHWQVLDDAPDRVNNMARKLVHRGPDDQGQWADENLAMSFRRLSILDLSNGHQPMTNQTGRYVLVFNGEIYNHAELRKELEAKGHHFLTQHSDTEVILLGYKEWGAEVSSRLNGMFAFAIWDRKERNLFLARDRYGIKPLYIAETEKGLVFSSEIKGILASNLIRRKLNVLGLASYLTVMNNWEERTFFDGIKLFPQGTSCQIQQGKSLIYDKYWDYEFNRRHNIHLDEATEEHNELLVNAVSRQIKADVPVASYLSGGIDSSAVTAIAHNHDPEIQTYTCMFDVSYAREDKINDERVDARYVREALGIKNTIEHEVIPNSLESVFEKVVYALEEPRVGFSYPNYIIAGRAAQDVKCILSGVGGDECHGGYVYRYQILESAQKNGFKNKIKSFLNLHEAKRVEMALFNILNVPFSDVELEALVIHKPLKDALSVAKMELRDEVKSKLQDLNAFDAMMYMDCKHFLNALLIVEDKLSMAHSLETRVPLLDNNLVDYLLTLPESMLYQDGIGKKIFRNSASKFLPEKISKKPKMGFGPPDSSWYRVDLKCYIQRVLLSDQLKELGLFNTAFIKKIVDDHLKGRGSNAAKIWALMNIVSWFNVFEVGYDVD